MAGPSHDELRLWTYDLPQAKPANRMIVRKPNGGPDRVRVTRRSALPVRPSMARERWASAVGGRARAAFAAGRAGEPTVFRSADGGARAAVERAATRRFPALTPLIVAASSRGQSREPPQRPAAGHFI
jgi:hypothetical protein